jgi:tetratricopeptide (TPR) repeat protein
LIELLAEDSIAAEKEFREGYEALESMGQEAFAGTSAAFLAQALYMQGRFDEAEHFARISEAAAEDEDMLKPEWAPTLARVLAKKGDLPGAENLAREAVAIAQETDDILARGDAAMALGEVLQAAGKGAEAIPFVQDAARIYEAKGILPYLDKARVLARELAPDSELA